MIAYAAIDLRAGRVVQLVGGRPENERLSLEDPMAVAERFVADGFAGLHVVDLDAALGEGSNRRDVHAIIETAGVPVQVGGGIRDSATLREMLDRGAARVVVGTRAVTDPDWLADVSASNPRRILVAADVRGQSIVTHGWRNDSGVGVADFLRRVGKLPLAGLLVTDVGREGTLGGIDTRFFGRLATLTDLPIIAAGGVGSIQDLRDLDGVGIAAAVVGTALYTGAVDPGAAAKEFNR